MNKKLFTSLVVILFFGSLVLLNSQEKPNDKKDLKKEGKANFEELTPGAKKAIEKGLEWLSKNQQKSGSFGGGTYPVASTSMAALAFMAGGYFPNRGKYGDNVKNALRFILKNVHKSGFIQEMGLGIYGGSRMHGHGFATLFLAEILGMTHGTENENNEVRNALRKAVKLIEYAQASNGGWTYEPQPSGDEGSVTITQVMALRAARNVGINITKKTIDKGIDYIKKCTDSNGMVRYSLSMGAGRGNSAALTAAGMCVLNYYGEYKDERIKKGLDYLLKTAPCIKGSSDGGDYGWSGHGLYAYYYATIAMYQEGGDYWTKWFPAVRDDLIKKQSSDGSWSDKSYGVDAALATAWAIQILEMPYRYLSIFQK